MPAPRPSNRPERPDLLRRRLSAAALSAPLLALPIAAARADSDDDYDSGQEIRRFEDPGPIRVSAQTSPSRRFLPSRLVVIGRAPDSGAEVVLDAPLPRRAPATRVDRIDLSGVPLAGQLFRPRPATAEIEPGQRVGGLFRAGDVLVASLEPFAPSDWPSAPVRLISRAPFTRNPVAFRLRPRYRSVAAAPSARGATPIGDVYASADGLVLAPPRAWLTGFDLQ